jgi:hypothetical protein
MAFVLPTNVTVGSVLTASRYNADVVENMTAIGGAWTSFTPTWTNLTVGNGTQSSAFMSAGKLYMVRVQLTLGSTSSVTGGPEFTLPNSVSLASAYDTNMPIGNAIFVDATGGNPWGIVLRSTTTAARCRFASLNASVTYGQSGGMDGSNPFTWTTNDKILAQFMFEAA